jgi:hypothetical protein
VGRCGEARDGVGSRRRVKASVRKASTLHNPRSGAKRLRSLAPRRLIRAGAGPLTGEGQCTHRIGFAPGFDAWSRRGSRFAPFLSRCRSDPGTLCDKIIVARRREARYGSGTQTRHSGDGAAAPGGSPTDVRLRDRERVPARSDGRFEVGEGTLYPILYRLEEAGQLRSERQTTDRGVPRKYYVNTDGGRAELHRQVEHWNSFVEAITSLMVFRELCR